MFGRTVHNCLNEMKTIRAYLCPSRKYRDNINTKSVSAIVRRGRIARLVAFSNGLTFAGYRSISSAN